MARKLKQAISKTPIKVEPITPLAAIEYTLNQLRRDITRFDERKEKFLEEAKVNLSAAIQWADSVLQLDHIARTFRNLILAFDEHRTGDPVQDLFILKNFVAHVRASNTRDLLHDYLRGASTSYSSNSVEHNHRAGAAHIESVFESVSYYIADAEKGLPS